MKEIAALVMSLSITNDKRKQGMEVVEYIRQKLEIIQEEAKQIKSDKRRTFGKEEGELVDKLSEICNYRCDARNRETVNRVMTRLGYIGYMDRPRFRQRMENCLKKRRLHDKDFHPSSRKPKEGGEKINRRREGSKKEFTSDGQQMQVVDTLNKVAPSSTLYVHDTYAYSQDFDENVGTVTLEEY